MVPDIYVTSDIYIVPLISIPHSHDCAVCQRIMTRLARNYNALPALSHFWASFDILSARAFYFLSDLKCLSGPLLFWVPRDHRGWQLPFPCCLPKNSSVNFPPCSCPHGALKDLGRKSPVLTWIWTNKTLTVTAQIFGLTEGSNSPLSNDFCAQIPSNLQVQPCSPTAGANLLRPQIPEE